MKTKTAEEVLTLIHDINSPLCALKGLLKEQKRKKDLEKAAVQKVVAICKQLSNYYPINKDEVNCLVDTIEEVLDLKEIEHPKLVFSTDFQPDLRDLAFTFSGFELQRVLSNLINNAVEAGASQVCIKICSQGQNILIKIIDNGTGFFAQQIAGVQNRSIPSNKTNGSGIGIGSGKEFMKSLSGSLRILSTPYVGTNIILSFPQHIFDSVDFGPVVS